MKDITAQMVLNAVNAELKEQAGYEIKPTEHILDIFDSLGVVELALGIEDRLGIDTLPVKEGYWESFSELQSQGKKRYYPTVQQFVDDLYQAIKQQNQPAA